MRHIAPALLIALSLGLSAHAQDCQGATLFKNDVLPAVPSGQTTFSVIPGLCEGEAAGAVLDLPGSGAPQRLTSVGVGFGAASGASGASAVVNLEVYDGVSFSGAVANLGPKVFDYANDVGGNLQLISSSVNEIDLSAYNVVVGNSGDTDFVVVVRILLNPNGSCATGYQTNLFTDNSQPPGFTCNPAITLPGRNLIDIEGQGWRDASKATITGIPLCPFFFSGNWVLRACGEDAEPQNPLQTIVNTPTVVPGGAASLTFSAPGFEGMPYLAAASGGTSPGIPLFSGTPGQVGIVPLNPDGIFMVSLNNSAVFVNFQGAIAGSGTSPGLIIVPNDPGLIGLDIYVAFLVIPPAPAPFAISDPGLVQVQ